MFCNGLHGKIDLRNGPKISVFGLWLLNWVTNCAKAIELKKDGYNIQLYNFDKFLTDQHSTMKKVSEKICKKLDDKSSKDVQAHL